MVGIKVIDRLFDASQVVKVKGILSTMYKDPTVTAPYNLFNATAAGSDATVVSEPSSREVKPFLVYFEKYLKKKSC
jgi:hypothetical protein